MATGVGEVGAHTTNPLGAHLESHTPKDVAFLRTERP